MMDLAAEKRTLDSMVHNTITVNPLYDFIFDSGLRTFAPVMQGKHILELGAGSCNFTQKLLAHAEAVDVVEGSSIICRNLVAKNLPALTIADSLFEQFIPDQKYTDVIASFVNEHVADPSVIYDIARKALLPNGHLFLIVPNREALSRQLAREMHLIANLDSLTEADLKNGHRRTYDMDSFSAEITSNDFTIQSIGGILLKPFADFQLVGWLKNGDLGKDHLHGLEKLGKTYPRLCLALYAVVTPASSTLPSA